MSIVACGMENAGGDGVNTENGERCGRHFCAYARPAVLAAEPNDDVRGDALFEAKPRAKPNGM